MRVQFYKMNKSLRLHECIHKLSRYIAHTHTHTHIHTQKEHSLWCHNPHKFCYQVIFADDVGYPQESPFFVDCVSCCLVELRHCGDGAWCCILLRSARKVIEGCKGLSLSLSLYIYKYIYIYIYIQRYGQ